MAPRFVEAGEAIRAAGAATSDVAERLPNWYSSKQGLTEESPAVFGTAGMGLTHAGGALVDGRDPAADITFAACALEPIELDTDLHDAADAFLANDPHAAADSFDSWRWVSSRERRRDWATERERWRRMEPPARSWKSRSRSSRCSTTCGSARSTLG